MELLAIALVGAVLIALIFTSLTSWKKVPEGNVGVLRVKHSFRGIQGEQSHIRTQGSMGVQASLLKPDRWYFLPSWYAEITYAPRTFIREGSFGVVFALDGRVPSVNRTIADHVECDSFQDGRRFLTGGGQQGPQQQILASGVYDINPELFDVVAVDSLEGKPYTLSPSDLRPVEIPEGRTGVVITLDGQDPSLLDGDTGPPIPGHENFQLPWIFLGQGGYRGVQAETLSPGVYRINPWFARVVQIPTRDLILEWNRKEEIVAANFDSSLDQIAVNVEGYKVWVDISQTIRIPATAAPLLVRRFGESEQEDLDDLFQVTRLPVQRFVERVLGETVVGYFHANIAEYSIGEFLASHAELREQVEHDIRTALAEYEVEAIRTTLGEFEFEQEGFDRLRREIAEKRKGTEGHVLDVDHLRIQEEGERIKISVKKGYKKADVAEVEELQRILGSENYGKERLVAQLVKMQVPEVLMGDPQALLGYMSLDAIRNLVTPPGRPQHEAIETPGKRRFASPDKPRFAQIEPENPRPGFKPRSSTSEDPISPDSGAES